MPILSSIPSRPADLPAGQWTKAALRVLRERYLLKDPRGTVIETPEELCWRVAWTVAQAERAWDAHEGRIRTLARAFYELMVRREFLPNCLSLDTFIAIGGGLQRLDEIPPGPINLRVPTDGEDARVTHRFANGPTQVLTIQTASGYQVRATPDHAFRIVDDTGSYVWRRAGDLRPNDWMALQPNFLSKASPVPLTPIAPTRHGPTGRPPRSAQLPPTMTPELAELVGFYMGNGYIKALRGQPTSLTLAVNAKDHDVVHRLTSVLSTLFALSPHTQPVRGKHCVVIALHSTQVCHFLIDNGLVKPAKAASAHVPAAILQGGRETAQAFLRGLFEADGSVGDRAIELFSISSRLIRECQLLLLGLGVHAQSKPHRKGFRLTVRKNQSGATFTHAIGFLGRRKTQRALAFLSPSSNAAKHPIPHQAAPLHAWYRTHQHRALYRPLARFMINGPYAKPITTEAFHEYRRRFPILDTSPVAAHAARQQLYDPVVSITPGTVEQTGDLHVPEAHTFLANGFVSHNSPTLMNAGKGRRLTLAACYALPIEDSIPGIFGTLGTAAMIQKSGGGTGFSFSRLRPKGSRVRSSGGTSSGPISFLRDAYDHMTDAVKQGSTRRGANMAILRCLAPDTPIHTLSGIIPIKDLTGTRPYLYACDPDRRRVHVIQATSVFISDRHRNLVRVWLDSDAYIDCTPDHRFLLANGTYREAQALILGDRLMAFEKSINQHGTSARYVRTIGCTGGHPEYEHRVVARDVLGETVNHSWHVHHKDENPLNNDPINLKMATRSQHAKEHNPNLMKAQRQIAARRRGRSLTETYGEEKAAQWRANLRAAKRIKNHRVVRVEPIGVQNEVYDISMPAFHNFVANGMFVHNCDHPDLLEFIDVKRSGGVSNFNISVAITDEFMESLEADGSYPLRARAGWPRPDGSDYQDGEPYLNPETGQPMTLRAREVWDRICQAAWATGDPGLFFIDRTNRWRANPVPSRYQVETTNPCVTGDTLVATPRGWVPAETLSAGDVILTPAGPRALATAVGCAHPVFRVRFSDGGELQATPGHQFFARRRSEPGAPWAPWHLDRLRPGDRVRVVRAGHPVLADLDGEAAILSIEPDGIEPVSVYDLFEPTTDTWLPQGYLSRGCGEQPLYPNDQCSLGSINLAAFVDSATREFDWDRLAAAVGLATRFLDDVLEVSPPPTPEIGEMVRAIRRIGLGVMGWADALIRLGVPYDSEEAVALAEKVMGFITKMAEQTSIELAQTRGAFPLWPESIYRDGPPRRNSTVTTIAPTGSLSILAGCSSGIEPLYAVAFTHTVRRPEGDRILHLVNPLFESLARTRGIYNERLMNDIAKRGTIRGLPDVPEDLQRFFGTAHEIAPAWHVRHQAAFQAHTCNGVSKTVNLPHSATVEDVSHAYRLAWDLGCLGITVFCDGCKGEQVLTVGTSSAPAIPKSSGPATEPGPAPDDAPLVRPRPPRLEGPTFKVDTPLGTAYITVTLQDGEPLEVFVNIGKSGTDTGAFAEALGRLVSTLLRLQRLPGRTDRAREVIDQLSQIGGSRDIGYGPQRIRSVPDAIAWALGQTLHPAPDLRQLALPASAPASGNNPAPHRLGDLCPTCGAAAVVWEEGCRHCLACGLYSEC